MSVEARKIKPGNSKQPIYKIIKENSLSLEDEIILKRYVERKGAIYMSTPFSIKASDFLNDIDVDLFKIGSGECNNYELIDHVSKFNKPMIISTGMNNIESIKKTVKIIEKNNCPGYALLHTTNLYPTPNKSVRLNCLKILNDKFKGACIGLSDHTTSNFSSYGAITLGAQIIERHFTDTKKRKGPDISCSMDPEEF
jgi:sialic acid synthase SpsE